MRSTQLAGSGGIIFFQEQELYLLSSFLRESTLLAEGGGIIVKYDMITLSNNKICIQFTITSTDI
jgi:hypothetical protein